MRRTDCECTDRDELEGVLHRAEWGSLGLVGADGAPVLVPLNFVYHQGRIYFHGAGAGEKIATLQADPRASFLVVEAYAQIPSYAFDPVRACPATQYFRSVLVKGRVSIETDPETKAGALEALMRKLQPEGGYEPITATSPLYRSALQGVTVVALAITEMTGKVKLGQRLTAEGRAQVEQVLATRGGPMDPHTQAEMQKRPNRD